MDARLTQLVARLRRGAPRDPIPLADLTPLAGPARRTRLLRLGLVVALVAAVVLASLSAPDAESRRFLPSATVGIVVLDISSSIRPSTHNLIRRNLDALSRSNRRFGVVLFSDDAYEALPPGTPASELRSFIRFFERRPIRYDRLGNPRPQSPWEQWFSAGTAISSGLLLAAELLQREHVEQGGVVLISDLVNDPSDYNRMIDTLALYSERQIPLSIVPLDPPPEERQIFETLLRDNGVIKAVELPTGQAGRGRLTIEAPFPTWLVVFGALVVVLLAVEAYWSEPLTWKRSA
jgi:hypothetical protein